MRVLLVALALVVMSGGVLAEGAAWQRKRVVVRDHTTTEWQSVVAETIAAFNATMPGSVPRLRWRPKPPVPCEAMPRTGRGITLCVLTDPDSMIGAETIYWQRGHEMSRRVRIRISSSLDALPRTICHELMHALTGVSDPDGSTPEGRDSCVQGLRDTPGAWDVGYARRVYRQHGRR